MEPEYLESRSFGPDEILEDDPYLCCLTGNRFYCGDQYGEKSMQCKAYMADRCTDKWDEACSTYAKHTDTFTADKQAMTSGIPATIGEQFIRRILENRYCTRSNCDVKCEMFNTRIPNSPEVCTYEGNCKLTCNNFTKEQLDNDQLFQHILTKRDVFGDLIDSIHESAKVNGVQLTSLPSTESSQAEDINWFLILRIGMILLGIVIAIVLYKRK